MPLLSLRNVSFGYSNQPVVVNVSLDIGEGDFIGLIGPNGAGKSTLLKGLLGLLPALSGDVTKHVPLDNHTGYVPQRDSLDPNYPLLVMDVVRMGATAHVPWYVFPDSSVRGQCLRALTKVGMDAFAAHPFSELSGGQRQRVLIARSLVLNPKLLVLDEPTSGVDAAAEDQIMELLARLNEHEQITILIVSHHLHSLRHFVKRVVAVKDGAVSIGDVNTMLSPDHVKDLLE